MARCDAMCRLLCSAALVLLMETVLSADVVHCDASSEEALASPACQAGGFAARLKSSRSQVISSRSTIRALEKLRLGIARGERLELHSSQRQHLAKGTPVMSEITLDYRHRPVSTNLSRHMTRIRSVATNIGELSHHILIPFAEAPKSFIQDDLPAMILAIDVKAQFHAYAHNGRILLDEFDLGHAKGAQVKEFQISPSMGYDPFIITADNHIRGARVTAFKYINDERHGPLPGSEEGPKERFHYVLARHNCQLNMSEDTGNLTAILPFDRSSGLSTEGWGGSQMHYLVGDSLGGISVFHRDCSLKGRIVVTQDEGGVRGLRRSHGKSVIFFSAHSFGYFSAQKVDLPYMPCSGWQTPIFDIVVDKQREETNRFTVAFEDGHVLLFDSMPGSADMCDMRLKFPTVSQLPLQIQFYRESYALALAKSLPSTPEADAPLQELFVFDLDTIHNGYGRTFSRAVAMQLAFRGPQPAEIQILAPLTDERPKDRPRPPRAVLSVRLGGRPGLELYELGLQPRPPLDVSLFAAITSEEMVCFLRWFSKVAAAALAVAGAIGFGLWKLYLYRSKKWEERRKKAEQERKKDGKEADGEREDDADDYDPVIPEVDDDDGRPVRRR